MTRCEKQADRPRNDPRAGSSWRVRPRRAARFRPAPRRAPARRAVLELLGGDPQPVQIADGSSVPASRPSLSSSSTSRACLPLPTARRRRSAGIVDPLQRHQRVDAADRAQGRDRRVRFCGVGGSELERAGARALCRLALRGPARSSSVPDAHCACSCGGHSGLSIQPPPLWLRLRKRPGKICRSRQCCRPRRARAPTRPIQISIHSMH